MHPFLIMNDSDLDRAIELVEEHWDAEPGTPEGHLVAVMSTLIDQYEASRTTLPPGDPVEIIAFKLRELGWSRRELARRLGWGSGRVSEILNRKRRLTLAMIQRLSEVLDLPPGLLVPDTDDHEGGHAWVALPPDLAEHLRADAARQGSALRAHVIQLLRRHVDVSVGRVISSGFTAPVRHESPTDDSPLYALTSVADHRTAA